MGDMASLNELPGVSEVAMQGGLHAANTIKRRLKGKEGASFKYRNLGTAAAIGRFKSIVSVHGIRLSGFPGWVVWFFVHIGFLNGFGNQAQHDVALVPHHGRARPTRTSVQRRAHRRRPEPARRREGEGHAACLPGPERTCRAGPSTWPKRTRLTNGTSGGRQRRARVTGVEPSHRRPTGACPGRVPLHCAR